MEGTEIIISRDRDCNDNQATIHIKRRNSSFAFVLDYIEMDKLRNQIDIYFENISEWK